MKEGDFMYNEELKQLQKEVMRNAQLEKELQLLYAQKVNLEEKVRELEEKKIAEQADVEKLERKSLAVLFYHIMNKHDEKIAKEKREAYAATVAYDVAMNELEVKKEEIRVREEEKKKLWGCELRYERKKKSQMELIKASDSPTVAEILQVEEKITKLDNQKKELQETVKEGNRAVAIIDSMLADVKEAKDLGVWDMLGGGTLVSFAKREKLEDAQKKVANLSITLSRFKTELADIDNISSAVQIHEDGFLEFADVFFDGLFVDFAMQGKINNKIAQLEEIKRKIEKNVAKVNSIKNEVEKQIEQEQKVVEELMVNCPYPKG